MHREKNHIAITIHRECTLSTSALPGCNGNCLPLWWAQTIYHVHMQSKVATNHTHFSQIKHQLIDQVLLLGYSSWNWSLFCMTYILGQSLFLAKCVHWYMWLSGKNEGHHMLIFSYLWPCQQTPEHRWLWFNSVCWNTRSKHIPSASFYSDNIHDAWTMWYSKSKISMHGWWPLFKEISKKTMWKMQMLDQIGIHITEQEIQENV